MRLGTQPAPNPDSALTAPPFHGRTPNGPGDLSVETHGIAPVPGDRRYGSPRRLFTVWFAPQVNMTGVFTGAIAIVLGLGFWLGLLAMVLGTVLGSLVVGYLSTWGPRTGSAQLPASRMAFGGGVFLPAALQWLSSIAWDALVGLFGGEALALLLDIPFWAAVLIVLGVQGVVGYFGYEVIHRVQAVLTVVLFVTFVVFAVKLVGGHDVVTPPTSHGADLVGSFVLMVTISFSLAVSWASYASDFSRYLPAKSSKVGVFAYTFTGVLTAYVFVQGIGVAAGEVVSAQTAEGVRSVMGGGFLGGLALLIIALASIGSGAMNDYSGSLELQPRGVRARRPEPGAGAHDAVGRRRGADDVRGGLRGGRPVHEHHRLHGARRRVVARCRRGLLRQLPCGAGALRRLPTGAPAAVRRKSI